MDNVKIPMDKLMNLDSGKYQVARAAMKIVDDLSKIDNFDSSISKPAVFSLASVLNGDVTFDFKKID